MGSRRIRPLTAGDLSLLPEPCVRCTFWESSLTDLVAPPEHREAVATKRAWAEAVTERWGYCGVIAVQDGVTVGFLTLAPAALVPRLAAFATTPVSQDAAVIMSARVVEGHRRRGIGRQLIQSAAAVVARRDIRALEVVATRHEGPSCMLPAPWLESCGFIEVRQHPVTPRLRMDVQTAVRWLPDLSQAWGRLAGLVAGPSGTPEPAASVVDSPNR